VEKEKRGKVAEVKPRSSFSPCPFLLFEGRAGFDTALTPSENPIMFFPV
jgi:hypothetical protein